MQITLTPDLEAFVREKVASGQYPSVSDVVNGALSEFQQREGEEEFTPEHRAYLQRELERGMDQARRGEFVEHDLEKIKAKGRERLAAERNGR